MMRQLLRIIRMILICFPLYSFSSNKLPLLDRSLFFGNPEISGGALSPDGRYLAFMKEHQGIMNIWIKPIDAPFEKARLLTDSNKPLAGYFWTQDSKYIIYARDQDGDENINIFVVDPHYPELKIPVSKNLTPQKNVQAKILLASKKNPDLMIIALNDRDKAWHDIYELNISTSSLTKIYENTERAVDFNFDWDENLRVISKTNEQGRTTMFHVDDLKSQRLTPIYDFDVTESAGIVGWNEDNTSLYLSTNKAPLNLQTLFKMDLASGQLTHMASDPKEKVDLASVLFNDLNRKMIAVNYMYDKKHIEWLDPEWKDLHAFLSSKFPGREVDIISTTKDYQKMLIAVWGDRYASDVYSYDHQTKKITHQYTPKPKLKEVESSLASMQSIQYASSDGLTIPAYLTLPVGQEHKNLPLIVLVHGGPKGPRDVWGFHPEVQFLANRGYAILQPNFRASGGYGKQFLNAGDLQWGKLMQDDISWGVQYLVNQGMVDKQKVVIMGASYGGYATLAGLAFTPDLYVAGIDIVGPSNLFTLLESIPPYWEAGRAFLYGMIGDPATEEGRKRIQEASPLFFVDHINKPLLIVQGANDPRVKQAESDQIVSALRKKNKQVSYLLAKDEGHGFSKPVNRMAMYAEIEKFLAEVLGGRYQDELPVDVEKRLNELKVDITKF
jgi:dipeptidyl aminopeptidase/acylaminoacyl peptidase